VSYEYRPSDTYLKQEIEYKKSLLKEEFKSADVNKDELLTEHELLSFLDSKVKFEISLLFDYLEQREAFW